MKLTGIIIIIIGLALTTYTGITFFTKEKVADIGKIEINREKPHYLDWSPWVGLVIIGIGGVVLWQSSKK